MLLFTTVSGLTETETEKYFTTEITLTTRQFTDITQEHKTVSKHMTSEDFCLLGTIQMYILID